MSASVVPFLAVKDRAEVLLQVREIFFESSTRKEFKDEIERDAFFEKYVGFYLRHYPELAWVGILGDKVLGYIVAAPKSTDTELCKIQPHLKAFEALFNEYPAHLHINCHHESRGMGLGSQLVKALEGELKASKIAGLHIMTGSDSANRNFYKKLGFDFESELPFRGVPILFMGKRL
ncbi:GNAT family N-acetyltransferase [Peredibacter sp. HCB2-198]|uniref:GNAT family N-acetyltransferase n=1 Tax=Peredibacter sp. HCB2-198 TaxID=3383025 RepID=UPI0038B47B17